MSNPLVAAIGFNFGISAILFVALAASVFLFKAPLDLKGIGWHLGCGNWNGMGTLTCYYLLFTIGEKFPLSIASCIAFAQLVNVRAGAALRGEAFPWWKWVASGAVAILLIVISLPTERVSVPKGLTVSTTRTSSTAGEEAWAMLPWSP